jgi:hypothetical protein
MLPQDISNPLDNDLKEFIPHRLRKRPVLSDRYTHRRGEVLIQLIMVIAESLGQGSSRERLSSSRDTEEKNY